MTDAIVARWDEFEALPVQALYDILKLRVDIFVVEQHCPYPEIDGLDPKALHLRLIENGKLLAYCRVFSPGAKSEAAVIGRVVVAPQARSRKLGRKLMQEAVSFCERQFPPSSVRLSAQHHLRAFYASFGFHPVSAIYDEDGIPHIDMERPPQC